MKFFFFISQWREYQENVKVTFVSPSRDILVPFQVQGCCKVKEFLFQKRSLDSPITLIHSLSSKIHMICIQTYYWTFTKTATRTYIISIVKHQ